MDLRLVGDLDGVVTVVDFVGMAFGDDAASIFS